MRSRRRFGASGAWLGCLRVDFDFTVLGFANFALTGFFFAAVLMTLRLATVLRLLGLRLLGLRLVGRVFFRAYPPLRLRAKARGKEKPKRTGENFMRAPALPCGAGDIPASLFLAQDDASRQSGDCSITATGRIF